MNSNICFKVPDEDGLLIPVKMESSTIPANNDEDLERDSVAIIKRFYTSEYPYEHYYAMVDYQSKKRASLTIE